MVGGGRQEFRCGSAAPPEPPTSLLLTAEALDVEAKYFAHCPLMFKLNSDAELVRKIRITKLGFPEG
eukprot:scaffold58107_cov70-Cyclotella_meneghiniana.AAC.4